jgi:hypothetical protein
MKSIKSFTDLSCRIATTKQTLRIAVVNPTDKATKEALRQVEKKQGSRGVRS